MGVVVIILIVLKIDIVEHDAQEGAAHAEDGLLDACEHRAREPPMLDNDNRLIDFAGQNRCVTHAQHRRRIEKDKVVTRFQLGDRVRHALRIENADGVGRKDSTGQDGKIFHRGG